MILYLSTLLLILRASSTVSVDVTREELQELGAACESFDSCSTRRPVDSLDRYTCHCSPDCYKYGTCCVDARSRNRRPPRRMPGCRPIDGDRAYFMVDSCPPTSVFENLCKEDDRAGDLMSQVPVTSLLSNTTYKNYFCFRCNEATDDFLYWNIRMNASGHDANDIAMDYDRDSRTWLAAGENGETAPVNILLEIPQEVEGLPRVCVPGAISNCSTKFRGRDAKKKCGMYTAYVFILKEVGKVLYRNPHCALCNSESLEMVECGLLSASRAAPAKRPFSFVLLLDVNQRDGDRVGMVRVCGGRENQVWDPFFKKCRTLTCALPGHVIRDGKCVAP